MSLVKNMVEQPTKTVASLLHGHQYDGRVEDLAQALQELHPDGLPLVTLRSNGGTSKPLPLAEVLVMRHGKRYQHLLPAIVKAYGGENQSPHIHQTVRGQMLSAFETMMSRWSYMAGEWTDDLWESMKFWGDRSLAQRMWSHPRGVGGGRIMLLLKDVDFQKQLVHLKHLGVALEQPTITPEYKRKVTLMGEAVNQARLDIVCALLALDVPPGKDEKNCKELLQSAKWAAERTSLADVTRQSRSKRIHETLRAAVARQQAQWALDEIMGLRQPPPKKQMVARKGSLFTKSQAARDA